MSFENEVMKTRLALTKGKPVPYYWEGKLTLMDSRDWRIENAAWREVQSAEHWIDCAKQLRHKG